MFEKFAEFFPFLVLRACVVLLVVLVVASFGWLLKRFGVFARLAEALGAFASLPQPQQAFVALFVAVLIVFGSTKVGDGANDGGGTNDAPTHLSAPRKMLRSLVEDWLIPQTPVTPAEIAEGYRAPVDGAAAIVAAPEGAVTNERWRLRGAHVDAFRPELVDWRFPYRDGVLTGVTVLARGEVRPDVGTLYFPVSPVDGVSLLPESRRDGAASLFWHALSPSNSLLLTWENALVGRDPNCPTNLQAELYADGRFAWRTDGGSRLYLPVLEFDWDGDGLENSVDPDPLVAGPDAHGTNAEWYKVVCSNVFEDVEWEGNGDWWEPNGMISLPAGVGFRAEATQGAYYSVDVVAERGPAPIYFTGDQPGFIGAPVVVARAGETNRVPLQVGVEYAVTSAVPFSLSFPMGGFAEVVRDDPCGKVIRWPVHFSVETRDDGHTVVVTPYPSDPGGTYVWWRPGASAGSGADRDAASDAGCSYSAYDGGVFFHCGFQDCGCTGCWLAGELVCDGVACPLPTVWCGCGDDVGTEDETPPPPTPDPFVGGLSISFSKPAVIFEDRYTNAPGDVVARRSTSTRLTVSASGGMFGGEFTLSASNLDKVMDGHGPGPLALIQGKVLEPYEIYQATFECLGVSESNSEGDVVVEGRFMETGSQRTEMPQGEVTVVRVELRKEWDAPLNVCINRHSYGVSEPFTIRRIPEIGGMHWDVNEAVTNIMGNRSEITVRSPVCPLEDPVTLRIGNVEFTPRVSIIEPSGIVVGAIEVLKDVYLKDEAGASMDMDLYVYPLSVSFAGLSVVEIPCDSGALNGYFADVFPNRQSHTVDWGAGRWFDVTAGNHVGESRVRDHVNSTLCPRPFYAGTLQWDIPIGWKPKAWGSETPHHKQFPTMYSLFDTITDQGTVSVRKFNHTLVRTTNDVYVLDGVVLP